VAKKNPKAKPWSPPSYDPNRIGEFVQARYGTLPAARQRAIYNRLRSQNAEFGEDPGGERTGLIRMTPQMLGRLPEGWGGEGAQNVGRARPQFDETRFEASQNSAGRYFLRPITEMSGLGPAQVAALREADSRSSAQQGLIKASYNSAADTAAKEAQELGGRLAAIPGATGMTSAPSSTAASTGAGDMERQAQAARTEQSLRATQDASRAALQAPAIRQTGISQANEYGTQAQAARANMLAQFRSSQAEAAAAADEMNARLRQQDMGLLGTQLRVGGQVNVANATNARQIAVNNANVAQRERQSIRTLQARLAQIDAQIAQANQRNDTQAASLLERQRVAQQRRLDTVVKDVSNLVQTEGRNVRQQRSQYVQMLVARGYPRVQAIRLANATIKG
jgi:hypothetical protein